jgi:O-antigen/teichoic acid export membrane protein
MPLNVNIVVNLAGKIWASALYLLLIPLYVRLVGPDGYGLIAFFATVQTIANVFDLGATTTVLRETAQLSGDDSRLAETGDLLRTIEATYWAIGLALGVSLIALSPLIVRQIHPGLLSPAVVKQALLLMSATLVVQRPLTLYGGAVTGLQRHALWNLVNVTGITGRAIGAVAVLAFVSPTVTAFFIWQVIASTVHTVAAMLTMWRVLPRAGRPRLRVSLLRGVQRFSLSVSGLTVLLVILGQIDKVTLIRTIPLGDFGEYSLASAVATGLFLCPAPINDTFLPRLCHLARAGDRPAGAATYHTACQLIMIMTSPGAAVLMLFPTLFLRVWTNDAVLAGRIGLLLTVLVAGYLISVATATLDLLQTAHGWLKPALISRAMALVFMGPCMVYAAIRYGGLGAAFAWMAIFVMSFAVAPFFTLKRLLPGEVMRWYVKDVLPPMGAAVTVCGFFRLATPPEGRLAGLVFLSMVAGMAGLASAAVTPAGHAALKELIGACLRRLP